MITKTQKLGIWQSIQYCQKEAKKQDQKQIEKKVDPGILNWIRKG